MYLPQELIRRKRDGYTLSDDEITFLVSGISSGRLVDSQVAALAMAIYFKDMSVQECTALTTAMLNSGERLNWQEFSLPGPIVDKHSTGGLGDMVSLVLAPIIAACGGYVPMVSGRGLGHTGGTIDKLESIAGYNVNPNRSQFQNLVKEIGLAIVAPSSDIAPADKRLYAIRDITATVDSLALVCSSILSKKLSEGLNSLVMDIKVGSGAFMPSQEQCERLARRMVAVATQAGCKTSAILTDMNQPLAPSCGNSLEVMEAMDYLTGQNKSSRLHQVVMALSEMLLVDSKLVDNAEQARLKISRVLDSGEAAERFNRMVAALGGPRNLLEQGKSHFPKAPVIAPLLAESSGYLTHLDCREIGMSVVALGGGRIQSDQMIDHRVGLSRWRQIGDYIHENEPLVMIHANDQSSWQKAARRLHGAISLEGEPGEIPSVVYQQIVS
ncbi:thymidine phosphorylase [Celerinatantimonas diazotrophica]|uniref:Thymidine phosphorylase n=1 Tax=Celerinatantimonas diazotrophica TaxID=412034 RepID=A0A4R1J9L8_9GAMM|nr:thymidine phosphorylase [Celerinatantimonas diazotrophica]TCK47127.1 thymidine phosphorylase [Celerinatantimonas diazotrophica]CAG9295899.1 Thymidine phosphorylase [Celerinatantimonas diazotrophica]